VAWPIGSRTRRSTCIDTPGPAASVANRPA